MLVLWVWVGRFGVRILWVTFGFVYVFDFGCYIDLCALTLFKWYCWVVVVVFYFVAVCCWLGFWLIRFCVLLFTFALMFYGNCICFGFLFDYSLFLSLFGLVALTPVLWCFMCLFWLLIVWFDWFCSCFRVSCAVVIVILLIYGC